MKNLNAVNFLNDDLNFDYNNICYDNITKECENTRVSQNIKVVSEEIEFKKLKMNKNISTSPRKMARGVMKSSSASRAGENFRQKNKKSDNFNCSNVLNDDIIVKNKKGAFKTQIVSENLTENLIDVSGFSEVSSPVLDMDNLIQKEWEKIGNCSGELPASPNGSEKSVGKLAETVEKAEKNVDIATKTVEKGEKNVDTTTKTVEKAGENPCELLSKIQPRVALSGENLNCADKVFSRAQTECENLEAGEKGTTLEESEECDENEEFEGLAECSLAQCGACEAVEPNACKQERKNQPKKFDGIGIVRVLEGRGSASSFGFDEIILNDVDESEPPLPEVKNFKCDLCNMTLSKEDVGSWNISGWVKFFLKSVKSVGYSLDYYDRLFDKHVKSSFYSSHIEKFGSVENFLVTMAEIIERKNVMKNLKAFVKRMYRELSDLEIMIVDRFVFNADNIDEILKKVSYRTMYRKAEKIIPKLSAFLLARGFTPEWCRNTFGKIM